MAFMPSEVPRLVHHYLLGEGYVEAANLFVGHCQPSHSKSLFPAGKLINSELSIFVGPTLLDLLEDYFKTKDYVMEKLKQLKCYNFRPQDCLLTQLESLIASFEPHAESTIRTNEEGADSGIRSIVSQNASAAVTCQGAAKENQPSIGEKHAAKKPNFPDSSTLGGTSTSSATSNDIFGAEDRPRSNGELLEASLPETLPLCSSDMNNLVSSGKEKQGRKALKTDARFKRELSAVTRLRSASRLASTESKVDAAPENRVTDSIQTNGTPSSTSIQFHDSTVSAIVPTQSHQQESVGTSSSELILSQSDKLVNYEMSPRENVCTQRDRASSPEMEPLRLEDSLDDADTEQRIDDSAAAPRAPRRRSKVRPRKMERENLIQELIALATRDMVGVTPSPRKKVRLEDPGIVAKNPIMKECRVLLTRLEQSSQFQ